MNDDASSAPMTSAEVPANVPPASPEAVVEAPSSPPSSSPYRAPPENVALPVAPLAAPRRYSMPGACLFVFGVLLWAFLLMGELTTSCAPGKHGMLVTEALAVVFVLAASGAAWETALRRSLEACPASSPIGAQARRALLAVVPFALWLFVLFCATALGKSASKNIDGPITSLLLIVSVASALGGPRMAGLRGPAARTHRRVFIRLAWLGAGLLTFVACVEVLAS